MAGKANPRPEQSWAVEARDDGDRRWCGSLQAGSSVENGARSKHPLRLKMARGRNIRAW